MSVYVPLCLPLRLSTFCLCVCFSHFISVQLLCLSVCLSVYCFRLLILPCCPTVYYICLSTVSVCRLYLSVYYVCLSTVSIRLLCLTDNLTLLSNCPPIWVSLQFLSMMYWMVELSIMKAYFPSESITFSIPSVFDDTITSARCMPVM